ncbi:MAG: hypothetical protein HUU55_23080 [Myxococcales bacterium]|nr:hypothetical protein [Myxococcales bacterium]
MIRPLGPLRFFLSVFVVALALSGCSDNGGDEPAEDTNPKEDTGTIDVDNTPDLIADIALDTGPDILDTGAPDAGGYALQECPESVINPFQLGAQMFYTCVSIGEILSIQQIRTVKAQTIAPKTLVEIPPPHRVGQVLAAKGDHLYYDTLTLDPAGNVTMRTIWRIPVDGGESEEVLSWGPEDSAETKAETYAQSSRILNFKLQPNGNRIAFTLAHINTRMGEGRMYIYDGAEKTYASDGVVTAFEWGATGNQLAYVLGPTLFISGADGSGANPVDESVVPTGVPPRYLSDGSVVYTKYSKTLMRFHSGGTTEIDVQFPADIRAMETITGTKLLILAKTLQVVDIETKDVVDLGEPPGFGLRKHITLAPDRTSFVVGYSLDNPFKSFEYRNFSFDNGAGLPLIATEKGAGAVSTTLEWK